MPIKEFKYIIVGGGIVAGYAAQEFTCHPEFKKDDLAIITDDDAVPYERPPLSKDFLAGKANYDDIQINVPKFYRENGIKLLLYTKVNTINPSEKTVHTDHGDKFRYEKLLLATGSSAVYLDVPGSKNSRVKHLRTLTDAKSIRNKLNDSTNVLVVGGGYIGMETAASMTQAGHNVTIVFPEERLMQRLFTPKLSEYFEQYYLDKGVTFIKGATVTHFDNSPTQQVRATLSNETTLDTDLVVVGIGATPNVSIVSDTHIEVDNGVLVNNRLQTSNPDIYAAGDIANYFDTIFHKRRRVEHWQNAVDMAKYSAREMLNIKQHDFRILPYFFSDIFDLSYEFWGDNDRANNILSTGNFEEDSISVWWLKSDLVVAALLMNRSEEERENAQYWIREHRVVNSEMFKRAIEVLS